MPTAQERDIRDIVRGAGANILGFLVRFGTRLPFIFLAGLLYGAAAFGRYTFVVAIVETIVCLPMLALHRTLFRYLSDAEIVADSQRFYRSVVNAVAVAGAAGVACTVLTVMLAEHLSRWFDVSGAAGPMRLFALTMPMTTVSTVLLAATRYRRIMRYEVYTRSVAEPVTISLGVAACYLLGWIEYGLVAAHLLSIAVGLIASVYYFGRSFSWRECLRQRPRWLEMAELVRYSAPTAVYEFLNIAITRVDVIMLAYFSSDVVVGVYGMAQQFITIPKKLRQAFDPILTPVVSQGLIEDDVPRVGHQLALVTRWILGSQIAVFLLFTFYAERLMGLVGEGFATGGVVLSLLTLGVVINGSLGVNELPLMYRRPMFNPVHTGAMMLLHIGICALLIPRFAGEGAAAATVITFAVMNVLRLVAVKRLLGVWTVRGFVAKPVIAGAATAVVLILLGRLVPPTAWGGVAIGTVALLSCYALALNLLGLEPEEETRVRRLLGASADTPNPR